MELGKMKMTIDEMRRIVHVADKAEFLYRQAEQRAREREQQAKALEVLALGRKQGRAGPVRLKAATGFHPRRVGCSGGKLIPVAQDDDLSVPDPFRAVASFHRSASRGVGMK